MLPSPRLIVLIAAAAPLFIAAGLWPAFLALAVIYLLTLSAYTLLDILLLPRKNSFEISRLIPDRISLRHPTGISFLVTNKSRRRVRLSLAENLPETMTASPPVVTAILQPGQTSRLTYTLTATSRGRFTFDNLFVRVLCTGSLVIGKFKLNTPHQVKVFANLINLKKYDLLTRKGLTGEEGLARLKRVGQGSEFESLRYYAHGDEMSRIAWKASAKRDKLIVKNYEPEKRQNVIVAIDLGRATAGEFAGLNRVDYMVNATLMLAYVALRQKDWFSVMAFSNKIHCYLPPVSGVKNIDLVAKTLFDLQPSLIESDYGLACRFLARKNRKRSLLCVMTDVLDAQSSDILIAYMARFARTHLPLAVTVANTEIQHIARQNLDDCRDIYSKAAALDILTAREEALIAMRRRGISVLDATPDKLTPALVSRYTLIKSRHRL